MRSKQEEKENSTLLSFPTIPPHPPVTHPQGTRIVCRLRHELFKSLLKQEVAFFDQNQSGELTNRLTADCAKISNVVSLNINIMSRQTIQARLGLTGPFSINTVLYTHATCASSHP